MDPRFSFLEPWAEISKRLRRIFKLNQYRPLGLCGLLVFADKFTAEAQKTQRLRRVILWSAAAGGRTPKRRMVKRRLASIAKCVATLVARFTRLAKVSPPVLDRTESGTRSLRLRLSTS